MTAIELAVLHLCGQLTSDEELPDSEAAEIQPILDWGEDILERENAKQVKKAS
jgi:hypothetical protein